MDFTEQNGGHAFPISIPGCGDNGAGGMTLRDWFAGQMLAGQWTGRQSDLAYAETPEMYAANAYRVADAMLAARQKPVIREIAP